MALKRQTMMEEIEVNMTHIRQFNTRVETLYKFLTSEKRSANFVFLIHCLTEQLRAKNNDILEWWTNLVDEADAKQ